MAVTMERVRGHYEVQEVPYGMGYVWVQGLGGAEAKGIEELLRPWHVDYERWKREERAHPEREQWMEIRGLD